MKNILFLIIDAMTNAYVDVDKAYSPTPFIDSLKANGISCTNMYSQGPYTEAALTPFYTGLDNLSNGGNFYRGNEVDKTTFEYLSESGYDVISYTQPLIFPDAMHRGINEERYGVSYFISAVWDYRLTYFQELYKSGEIKSFDYERIYKIMDANFAFAIKYYEEYRDNSRKFDFISKFTGEFELEKNLSIIKSEYKNYLKDKRFYIEELFKQGMSHNLFTIEKIDMNSKADNEDIYKKIFAKYQDFFKEISRVNKQSKTNNEYNFINTAIKTLTIFLPPVI